MPFFEQRRLLVGLLCSLVLAGVDDTLAQTLQPGFEVVQVKGGLQAPTAIRFSPDGRIFVAEKSGRIKVFDSIDDQAPDVFADLRVQVYNFWDRGLLGLALHPNFPSTPYVYVSYAFDGVVDEEANQLYGYAPKWGSVPPTDADPCPDPPGATSKPGGCVVAGRISRLEALGNQMVPGSEHVLVHDFFQQYPSHSMGGLVFGQDGFLYATSGDGASFGATDRGQFGSTPPAGFPPEVFPDDPENQGGAVRSQDMETGGDAVGLSGVLLRIDPMTGEAASGNPLLGHADENARRIVGYGLRNPFRLTRRPGTGEIWISDVGWGTFEEINRHPSPSSTVLNFGWPCFSGDTRHASYQAANLDICLELYAEEDGQPNQAFRPHQEPHFAYRHSTAIGECSTTGSSSITGIAFYEGGSYPAAYDDALFFADYSRKCIYVMRDTDGNGIPDTTGAFLWGGIGVADLQIGPDGDLFIVEVQGGKIWRVQYVENETPTARITLLSGSTAGSAPLSVHFDASTSTDPDSDPLVYGWDLDGDGAYDDSSQVSPQFNYNSPGVFVVGLEVTDIVGNRDTDSIVVTASNSPPAPVITSPAGGAVFGAGDSISYSGSASDAQDGPLSGDALEWTLVIQHCEGDDDCHVHTLFEDLSGASGVFGGPDHELPSWLELTLTATDSSGLSASVTRRIDPEVVQLTLESEPAGLDLVFGNEAPMQAPFSSSVMRGGTVSVAAPSPQVENSIEYAFKQWSDQGDPSHEVVLNGNMTLSAEFQPAVDLSVDVDLVDDEVEVGRTLVFEIEVSNAGPESASTLYVDPGLGDGLEFASFSGDGWSCTGTEAPLCTRSDLAADGASPTLYVVATAVAPGSSLTLATVGSDTEVDVVSSNDQSFALAELLAPTPPQLETVRVIPVSALAGQDGQLERNSLLPPTVTQLHVAFSESMEDPAGDVEAVDVSNPAHYKLVEVVGAAPQTCAEADREVDVWAMNYDSASATMMLQVNSYLALQEGSYRLLLCAAGLRDLAGNALDGDQDGSGGDDAVLDFNVVGVNLIRNPNFDYGFAGWIASSPLGYQEIHPLDEDRSLVPTSMSVQAINLSEVSGDYQITHCVPELPPSDGGALGLGLRFSTWALADTGTSAGLGVVLEIEAFDQEQCGGQSLWRKTGGGVVGSTWSQLSMPHSTGPLDRSLRLKVRIESRGDIWFDARFDETLLTLESTLHLFSVGFETGDLRDFF